VVGGLVVGGATMGLIGGGLYQPVQQLINFRKFRTMARVPVQVSVIRVGQRDLERTTLRIDNSGGFEKRIRHKPLTSAAWFTDHNPSVVLNGDEAIRVARHLFHQLNHAGGSKGRCERCRARSRNGGRRA